MAQVLDNIESIKKKNALKNRTYIYIYIPLF